MQIGKLSVGQQALPIFGSKSEQGAAQLGDLIAANTTGGNESTSADSSACRQILANYDVSSISPREFSQLLNELHVSGAINDNELQQLSAIRFELDKAELDPDEKLDLVQLFSERLKQQVQSTKDAALGREESELSPESQKEAIALTQRRLEWLQKFATLHAEGEDAAVDAFA